MEDEVGNVENHHNVFFSCGKGDLIDGFVAVCHSLTVLKKYRNRLWSDVIDIDHQAEKCPSLPPYTFKTHVKA